MSFPSATTLKHDGISILQRPEGNNNCNNNIKGRILALAPLFRSALQFPWGLEASTFTNQPSKHPGGSGCTPVNAAIQ